MNEAISARKKFIAPVMVPICARATAFCIDTTLVGKAVPSPSAKIDSSTSMPHSGSVVSASAVALTAATEVPTMATRL